jgi:hypothetical protein
VSQKFFSDVRSLLQKVLRLLGASRERERVERGRCESRERERVERGSRERQRIESGRCVRREYRE